MSSENHPYTQSQKIKYENNEYLAEISNWENIKTFILPNEFVKRKFDVILDHIDKEFKERGLRNVFYENQYEYSKIHKCRRYSECMCRVFVRDLLQIAYYKKTENVHKYLERYILKPQIYLPFNELMLWLQLEVTRKNLSQAEAIVKRYIANTTNLIDDETKGAVALDLKKKDGPKDPWKPKPENLTLKESEYYKLVDLYLFDIVLPEKGYDEAKNLLIKEIAMDREKKTEYLEKLSDLYKNAIRETSLMHGTEAIKQLNKAKVKNDVSSQIDKIKAMPNQPVDSQVDPQSANPLYESTFMRNSTAQRNRSNEEQGEQWWLSKYLSTYKLQVNPKTFAGIMLLLVMIWLWRGGYRKMKNIKITKFILKHVFGIKTS